jgi:lysozyme
MPATDIKTRIAAIGIATTMIAGAEGVVLKVYRDPVGIPTYCFGETRAPDWSRRYSMEECRTILAARVAESVEAVESCVRVPLATHELAAMASFEYNVGKGAFCGSTFVRKVNAGQLPAACSELSRWVYAAGIKLPGLVKRRAEERAMCEGRR